MNTRERLFIVGILAAIILLVASDLFSDYGEGAAWWHLLVEAGVAAIALVGILVLLRGQFERKRNLAAAHARAEFLQIEAQEWKAQSQKYTQGLVQAIHEQMERWKLSAAEREVAFLLLKGLSLKEVAQVRQTTEKTARVQATAIYEKSGLAGRSELSAFFLEDMFGGQTHINDQ